MKNILLSIKKSLVLALAGGFLVLTPALAANYISPQNVRVDTASIAPTSLKLTWQNGGGDGNNIILWRSIDGQQYQFETFLPTTQTAYTFANLSPNSPYWFQIASGDDIGASSAPIAVGPTYSGAQAPRVPVISNLTQNALQISIAAGDGNPAGVTYFIREISQTGMYVQEDGTLGNNPFVGYPTEWSNKSVSGLLSGATYEFIAVAKNSAGVNSSPSPKASVTMPSPPPTINKPAAPRVSNATQNSIDVSVSNRENPSGTMYAIRVNGNGFVNNEGMVSTAMTFKTSADWGTKTVKGLTASTNYTFEAVTIDHKGMILVSAPAVLATLAALAPAPVPAPVPVAPAKPVPTPVQPSTSKSKTVTVPAVSSTPTLVVIEPRVTTTTEEDSAKTVSYADSLSPTSPSNPGFNWLLWIGLPLLIIVGLIFLLFKVLKGREG